MNSALTALCKDLIQHVESKKSITFLIMLHSKVWAGVKACSCTTCKDHPHLIMVPGVPTGNLPTGLYQLHSVHEAVEESSNFHSTLSAQSSISKGQTAANIFTLLTHHTDVQVKQE